MHEVKGEESEKELKGDGRKEGRSGGKRLIWEKRSDEERKEEV